VRWLLLLLLLLPVGWRGVETSVINVVGSSNTNVGTAMHVQSGALQPLVAVDSA
jgi:hypothetical protein